MSIRKPTLGARVAAKMLRTRWLVRAPIWLYRARLGFVFGDRLLMLEHIGRMSCQTRYVVLEVVDHLGDAFIVAAGFGERAQWLRNLAANPNARVSVGTRVRVPVRATRLSSAEVVEVLHHYVDKHPHAWAELSPVFEQTLGAPINESGTTLPMIRLSPAIAGGQS